MFDSSVKAFNVRIGADGAVSFHGVDVNLSTQETRFLRALLLNAGRAVSFDSLMLAIQHDEDSAPEGEILKVLAYKVRKKLQKINPRHGIRTFVGTGYGIGAVAPVAAPVNPSPMTFHNAMMTFLDTATHGGKSEMGAEHYIIREALRLAHMQGAPIQSESELIGAVRAFREGRISRRA